MLCCLLVPLWSLPSVLAWKKGERLGLTPLHRFRLDVWVSPSLLEAARLVGSSGGAIMNNGKFQKPVFVHQQFFLYSCYQKRDPRQGKIPHNKEKAGATRIGLCG